MDRYEAGQVCNSTGVFSFCDDTFLIFTIEKNNKSAGKTSNIQKIRNSI